MEGRVSRLFYGIQCLHLANTHSRINGDDWMRGLINRLIHISHSLWLFRNFTLHDTQYGYKQLKDKAMVQLQIIYLVRWTPNEYQNTATFCLR
jgi:hypothetical protein